MDDGINGLTLDDGAAGLSLASQALECPSAVPAALITAGGDSALKTIITVALTAAGLYKQYEALGKQGDLFEAQKQVTLRNVALSERTFTETFLPAYKLSTDYFEKGFRKQWEPFLTKIVACGTKECEYVADYNRHTNRGLADAAKVISGAKRTAKRALDAYSLGACAEQAFKFAELQSRMVLDAKSLGRAAEEDFKLRKDAFYWNRLTTAAAIAQNVGSLAANLMIQGKGSLVNGLQAINQAASGFDAAVASGFSTLRNEGSFYGGLGASVSGLVNGRSSSADAAALANQGTLSGLPNAPTFFDTLFKSGQAYTPGQVTTNPASMGTTNRSGQVTTNSGFDVGVLSGADNLVNGLF